MPSSNTPNAQVQVSEDTHLYEGIVCSPLLINPSYVHGQPAYCRHSYSQSLDLGMMTKFMMKINFKNLAAGAVIDIPRGLNTDDESGRKEGGSTCAPWARPNRISHPHRERTITVDSVLNPSPKNSWGSCTRPRYNQVMLLIDDSCQKTLT